MRLPSPSSPFLPLFFVFKYFLAWWWLNLTTFHCLGRNFDTEIDPYESPRKGQTILFFSSRSPLFNHFRYNFHYNIL
ncbi:hypothetical protein F4809DRAFT_620437, partial [Biscogniauxia mediterranea]